MTKHILLVVLCSLGFGTMGGFLSRILISPPKLNGKVLGDLRALEERVKAIEEQQSALEKHFGSLAKKLPVDSRTLNKAIEEAVRENREKRNKLEETLRKIERLNKEDN